MTGIPDDDSLEDQLKWRRFADRVDRLFKPSRRKRAELAEALVMARNGFPNLTMDEVRLVGASVLLLFVALALMSPAENWNPRGPKPKTMDEYVGDVWNLDGLAIAEPGYMDPLSGFPRIKGSYRVSWKRNGRRVEGTLGIDGANVELRDNQGMIVSPVNPGTPVWKPGAKHSKG